LHIKHVLLNDDFVVTEKVAAQKIPYHLEVALARSTREELVFSVKEGGDL
jgi:hypothetical protein